MEKLRPMTHSQVVYWFKLMPIWVKLNVDDCSKGNLGSAREGGIIRDCNGNMITTFIEFYGHCFDNIARAREIWKGVNMCKNADMLNVKWSRTHCWLWIYSTKNLNHLSKSTILIIDRILRDISYDG